jgi:hypothetical protein
MRVLLFSVHSPFDFRYAEQHGNEVAMLKEVERCEAANSDAARNLSIEVFQDLCNDEEINLEDYFIYFWESKYDK